MAIKTHLSKTRPGVFGGTSTGTLCQRLRILADGMNVTTDEAKVTCKFCLGLMAAAAKRAERERAA